MLIMKSVKKVNRRKFSNGWTYAEAQKHWRIANRENKLNKYGRITFKEWIRTLIYIEER